MALDFRNDEAVLSGSCGPEEALELAEWLAKQKHARINLGDCEHFHTAILQTLLAFQPPISVAPEDPFAKRWFFPMLGAKRDAV